MSEGVRGAAVDADLYYMALVYCRIVSSECNIKPLLFHGNSVFNFYPALFGDFLHRMRGKV